MKTFPLLIGLVVIVLTSAHAQTFTWDGNGDPNASGNWSTSTNWNPDGIPAAGGNIAVLGDVATGTRTVSYDTGAGGFLSTLQMTQSTAGAVNLLNLQRSLTISNAITLGATDGTAQITVSAPASGNNVLTAVSGLTLNANSILALTGATNTTLGNFGGNLTISGGILQISATTAASSVNNTVNGGLIMTSGAIVIDNTGTGVQSDRRLSITGNVDISGGTIYTTRSGTSGQITFTGDTISVNPVSFDADLILTLDRAGNQAFTTNQSLSGSLLLRGSGVKTVTRTGDTTINALSFIDGNNSAAVGTYLKLGSDLTLALNALQPTAVNFGQTIDTSSAIQVGIDANGHTLDLTSGASSGVWTPNKSTQSGVTTTVWTLSNSGTAGTGVIAAKAFNFNSSGVTTHVGSGLVLEARGGNSTNNVLSGTGTIAATAIFRYKGTAASTAMATLVSNRTIGALEVQSGFLNINQAALATGGYIAVSGGGLSFNGTSAGSVTLAAGQNFSMTGGTITLTLGTSFDQIISSGGASAFSLTGGVLELDLESGFLYTDSYALFSGFNSGTVSGISITGYDTANYLATLGTDGVLSFAAVPEPGTTALLISSGIALLIFGRSRRSRRA